MNLAVAAVVLCDGVLFDHPSVSIFPVHPEEQGRGETPLTFASALRWLLTSC